ncbi:hypothetical protein OH786_32120 [Streptomyces atratus]|uniref:SsfX3-like N-terminal domain-containing protein n=1 Tax=Streptomyces atratus TaxID=1893 RepID=A0A1K2EYZ6_STRAR|nr:hypothetical protein [Streptomyces atratus]SFY40302.1 hypothetical protein SAMN02787144_102517 [Streptomyces atratus]
MAAKRVLAGDDPVLRFRGAVSLQHGPGRVAPRRVPHREAELHLPEAGAPVHPPGPGPRWWPGTPVSI